ncbi:MAG: hypothetical protein KDE09_10420 [Anaerolineales bacterium]|nr:hypothetical protein [Anaerolineales bacterium]
MMEFTKADRRKLKAYFARYSIPTEENFADLIDGTLNQNDDGIVKLPNEPLSIQASGAPEGSRATLNLYNDFANPAPDWTLTLRGEGEDGALSREGLNITDSAGQSRLFIDKASGNVGLGTTMPQQKLEVAGIIRAQGFELSQRENPLRHRMYPADPIIYQNIFEPYRSGVMKKIGNPIGWDDTAYAQTQWHGRLIINIGTGENADGNGVEINIPAGYNTLWIRVLGERWETFKAYFLDGAQETVGIWSGGLRNNNHFSPDGSLSDGNNMDANAYGPNWPEAYAVRNSVTDKSLSGNQWLPIPVGRAGRLALVTKNYTQFGGWLSGLAFSRNPWGHASLPAVSYHWAFNGGNATRWDGQWVNWYGDTLTALQNNATTTLRVPVMPTGRDKLFYMVEHNNYWNGAFHREIRVKGTPVERFLSTYDNPFARHFNGKTYARYIAARIPAGLITSTDRFLDVAIDGTATEIAIFFREAGTHDMDVPPLAEA